MSTKLPLNAHMGRVALSVADLGRSLAYYQERIGLQLLRSDGAVAVLGTPERELLHLQEQPGAHPTRGTTGLYHFALLLPSRLDLAKRLRHLIDTETRLDGAADHNVSEALYLTDPDGHGIEIYRDRPRSQWQYANGALKMGTDAFDVNGVLAELNGKISDFSPMPDQTVMGHVHLHVRQLNEALDFYTKAVGFDLIMRYGPSAGFVSAGGYHHHLGLNTWAGVGALPAPNETARLLWYEIVVGDETAVSELEARLKNAGVVAERNGRSLQFQDPSANTVHVIAG
ncbi:MAG: VOC family protein [Anaerolineae bacterium]|nr:VOC family protein [Anaerolineae bacterium]